MEAPAAGPQMRPDLLRLVIAGSVDDGKSTLVGRLLHDSGSLYEDHIESLAQLAARSGETRMDLSLVTDGLKAEREQGVTIDVAYRYFGTARRRFIVIDAPGHEQYTRNMATGASSAGLAVLLVDAKLGMLTQTRRHAFICSLLGIPRVVLAVNKMDLVQYSEARFDQIRQEFEAFAMRLGFKGIEFIPMSALNGDNVVRAGPHMPWHRGPSLLEHLEGVYIGGDRNLVDLRFPVQRVARSGEERWYCGRVGSGAMKVGDEVIALPSRRSSRVRAISLHERSIDIAFAPQSVAVALEDDVEVGRGALLAHARNVPKGVREAEAMMVWMRDEPLRAGRTFLLQDAAGWFRASCAEVAYRVDPDTLHRRSAGSLRLNDIGRVRLVLFEERFLDSYAANRGTGALIVVDPDSNATAGAAMVVERAPLQARIGRSEAGKRLPLLAPGAVSGVQRARLLGQRPVTVWLTGLSGAGKSTLATHLERQLTDAGRSCYLLDGDNVRAGINRDLGFGAQDRRENIRRVAEIARLMNDAGLVVITALISPYRSDREMARAIVGADRFIEIYLDASLEICERRDPKGLYRRARAGTLPEFTGISAPYEPPQAPDLVLATGTRAPDDCVAELLALVAAQIRSV